MPAIAYTVTATLPDEDTRARYIAWLQSGHLAGVIAGGARSAELVRIDDPGQPLEVQTRYVFAGREAFDVYVRDHAPALRAEGLKRFGPGTGVTFRRQVGTILD